MINKKEKRKEGREGRRMEREGEERERSFERSDINSGVISCHITQGAQPGTL